MLPNNAPFRKNGALNPWSNFEEVDSSFFLLFQNLFT